MSLLGNAAALKTLQNQENCLQSEQGRDKEEIAGEGVDATTCSHSANPGKKVSNIGRSSSDSLLAAVKKSTSQSKNNFGLDKPKPEFHIPKHGHNKHFNMKAKDLEELIE